LILDGRDRDSAGAFRGMSGTERPDFEVRDEDAESRFALGYRQSELGERVAGHWGARPSSSAGSDFGVARIVGVFDATIGVSAAQPFFRGPQIEGVASLLQ
jgi:hypothetical protein